MERKWYNIDYIFTAIFSCIFVVSMYTYLISTDLRGDNSIAYNIVMAITGFWIFGYFPVFIVETVKIYKRYKKVNRYMVRIRKIHIKLKRMHYI